MGRGKYTRPPKLRFTINVHVGAPELLDDESITDALKDIDLCESLEQALSQPVIITWSDADADADLLAACKAAWDLAQSDSHSMKAACMKVRQILKEAIAKAEGGAS